MTVMPLVGRQGGGAHGGKGVLTENCVTPTAA